jgi:hypothetical protein
MEGRIPEDSLLGRLKQMTDPRRRQGKIYPLGSLLGMLILAALNGESSLRWMWLWGCDHWAIISRPLGFTGQRHPPSYGTVWYVVSRLDVAQVEVLSVDGKVLRGSRRTDPAEAALEVVTLVAQQFKQIVGQQPVDQEGYVRATVQLLRAVPLKGKLVTMDAGLLHRSVVKTIVASEGDYLGSLKSNEPEVKQMVEAWLQAKLSPSGSPASG